jgi:hypothetical protein
MKVSAPCRDPVDVLARGMKVTETSGGLWAELQRERAQRERSVSGSFANSGRPSREPPGRPLRPSATGSGRLLPMSENRRSFTSRTARLKRRHGRRTSVRALPSSTGCSRSASATGQSSRSLPRGRPAPATGRAARCLRRGRRRFRGVRRAQRRHRPVPTRLPCGGPGSCLAVLHSGLGLLCPEGFPHQTRAVYRPDPKEAVIEWELPPQSVIPLDRDFRYVASRDSIDVLPRAEKVIKARYGGVISQVALRTIHEILVSTPGSVIDIVTSTAMSPRRTRRAASRARSSRKWACEPGTRRRSRTTASTRSR